MNRTIIGLLNSPERQTAVTSSSDLGSSTYVTATAVTTRTATTHKDLGKKAKTEQLEEKTVSTTRTHDPSKQEQCVVTQEVKTTATVTSGNQVNLTYSMHEFHYNICFSFIMIY